MKTKATVELLARVGQASVIKKMPNGKNYLSFTAAHNEAWKDAQGVQHERSTWWSVLYPVREGSTLSLLSGSVVLVRGNISTSIYRAKDGTMQVGLNLSARELDIIGMLEKKNTLSEMPANIESREYDTETAPNIPTDVIESDDLPY